MQEFKPYVAHDAKVDEFTLRPSCWARCSACSSAR